MSRGRTLAYVWLAIACGLAACNEVEGKANESTAAINGLPAEGTTTVASNEARTEGSANRADDSLHDRQQYAPEPAEIVEYEPMAQAEEADQEASVMASSGQPMRRLSMAARPRPRALGGVGGMFSEVREVPRDRGHGQRPTPPRTATPAPTTPRARPNLDPAPDPGMAAATGGRGVLDSAPLPQNGVLASNFVGGSGVRARLDDLLDRGVMVGGELVRLEAFQDRQRLPYAVPAREGMAMYAELERTRLTESTDRVHLQIALMGRQGEAPRRPHMDIRLVLDRSGSMRGEKWQQAIAAAHALIDQLEPNDRFGLITYSDDARVDHAPRPVGNRQAAHANLNRLVPGGGTNISAALELADEHAPRARSNQTVGLTILISDGRATMGMLNAQELGDIARRSFDRAGVLTTAIGLGTDFDENTMLNIAREGSGSYHFVRRAGDISDILRDELDERIQAVAQALRVRVELGEGVVARRVYGSRLLSEREHAAVRATEVAVDSRIARELGIARTRQQEEDRGLRIHLPTFRRGDQHAILMELEVPRGTGTTSVAKVTLDYKDLIRRQNGRIVREVVADRVDDLATAQASVNRPVKRTVLAFQGGEALQEAADALQRGDAATAHRVLSERRELLEAASQHWRDPSLGADAVLLSRYERVVDHAWRDWDSGAQNTLVMAMNYFGDQRMR